MQISPKIFYGAGSTSARHISCSADGPSRSSQERCEAEKMTGALPRWLRLYSRKVPTKVAQGGHVHLLFLD